MNSMLLRNNFVSMQMSALAMLLALTSVFFAGCTHSRQRSVSSNDGIVDTGNQGWEQIQCNSLGEVIWQNTTYLVSYLEHRNVNNKKRGEIVFAEDGQLLEWRIGLIDADNPSLTWKESSAWIVLESGVEYECSRMLDRLSAGGDHYFITYYEWEQACETFVRELIDSAFEDYQAEGHEGLSQHLILRPDNIPDEISEYSIVGVDSIYIASELRFSKYWECVVQVSVDTVGSEPQSIQVNVRGFDFDGGPGDRNQLWIGDVVPPLPQR